MVVKLMGSRSVELLIVCAWSDERPVVHCSHAFSPRLSSISQSDVTHTAAKLTAAAARTAS